MGIFDFLRRNQTGIVRVTPPRAARLDGLVNTLLGLGTWSDKVQRGSFEPEELRDDEIYNAIRGNDIVEKIICSLPEQATDSAYEASVDVKALDKAYGVLGTVHDAWVQARAYGGAAIFFATNADPRTPMGPKEKVLSLHVIPRSQVSVFQWYREFFGTNFARPQWFSINLGGTHYAQVHESRMVIVQGKKAPLPSLVQSSDQFWGYSSLVPVIASIRAFETGIGSIGALLADASQPVFKIEDLYGKLAHDEAAIATRLSLMQMQRSSGRAIAMDTAEDLIRVNSNLGGVDPLMDRLEGRIASAAEMQRSDLFGMGPAGMNATGVYDKEITQRRISKAQKKWAKPLLEQVFAKLGVVTELTFKAEAPAKATQLAEEKTQAEIDVIYINAGVLTPEQVAKARFVSPHYMGEIEVDLAELEQSARDARVPSPAEPPKDASSVQESPHEISRTTESVAKETG